MSPNDEFQARVEATEASEDDATLPSPSPAKKSKEYGTSQTPDATSLSRERPSDYAAAAEGNSVILRVKHECFGLARGTMSAEDYAAPNSKCIKCSECGESTFHCIYEIRRVYRMSYHIAFRPSELADGRQHYCLLSVA